MILVFLQNDSVDKTTDLDANLMTTSKIRLNYYSPHGFSMKCENTTNRDVLRSLEKYTDYERFLFLQFL